MNSFCHRPRACFRTLALCASVALSGVLVAQDQPAAPASRESFISTGPEQPGEQGRLVQVQAHFLEISPGALATSPTLREIFASPPEQKTPLSSRVINQAQSDRLLAEVQTTKGLTVAATPSVTTKFNQQAMVEIIKELRYVSEWQPKQPEDPWQPKEFETKNVGLSLEVKPQAGPAGSIDLHVSPQIVEFLGYINAVTQQPVVAAKYDPQAPLGLRTMASPPEFGGAVPPLQPIFRTAKSTTDISLQAGETLVFPSLRFTAAAQPRLFPALPDEANQIVVLVSAKSVLAQP